MTEEEPEIPDIQRLEREIGERMGDLIDYNAEMTQINRKIARDMIELANVYHVLGGKAKEISDLLFEQAALTAETTYDIIMAESGLGDSDDEEDYEDEEGEDCD